MYGRLLQGNREIFVPPWGPFPGPHREDRRSSPMMNGTEKSDLPIVPAKPANKAAQAAAEPVEGSGGTKRNAGLQSTVRTQSREAVSQAQARIRGAVTRNKKEKLTALLHHVSIDGSAVGLLQLKKRAAPGVDGLTWDQYAADLETNLADLHARVHAGTYRALPSRRKYIPKAGWQTTAARHRRHRGQDRPGSGGGHPHADLRGGVPGV